MTEFSPPEVRKPPKDLLIDLAKVDIYGIGTIAASMLLGRPYDTKLSQKDE